MVKNPPMVSPTVADADKIKEVGPKDAEQKPADDKEEAALPNLGLADSAGHKGAIAVDGDTPIEGLLLAYQSVGKIAAKICKRVLTHKPSLVLMHNPADFKAIDSLRVFVGESDLIKSDLERVAAEARELLDDSRVQRSFVESAAVVGAAITSVLQLVSLFRTDYKLKYSKIEVEDQVLAVTVAGAMKTAGIPVYNTALIPLASKSSGAVFGRLDTLKELRSGLIGLGDRLHALIGDKVTADDGAVEPRKSSLAEAYARIVGAVASVDAFLGNLSKINETTNASRLSQLIAAETLNAVLDEKALVLWVKAVAAGGGSRSKEGTFSSGVTYSGGAIASFALYDRTGELVEADTLSMYSGFVRDLPEGKLGKFDD